MAYNPSTPYAQQGYPQHRPSQVSPPNTSYPYYGQGPQTPQIPSTQSYGPPQPGGFQAFGTPMQHHPQVGGYGGYPPAGLFSSLSFSGDVQLFAQTSTALKATQEAALYMSLREVLTSLREPFSLRLVVQRQYVGFLGIGGIPKAVQTHGSDETWARPPIQGGPNPQHPPPGADPSLWYWFKAVDTDNSGSLTTEELQRALINGDWTPFNYETVRLMMNMFDTDNSGTISFPEFAGLWKYIEDWKACFSRFDTDGSGTINFGEMRVALRTFGYNLSDNFVGLLIKKYDKYGNQDVTFDNFVQSCVTIKTLTDAFRRFDTDGDGWIHISYEKFLELVVNNR